MTVDTLCTATTEQTVDFYVSSNGGRNSRTPEPLNRLRQFDYVKLEMRIKFVGNQLDGVIAFDKVNGPAREPATPSI